MKRIRLLLSATFLTLAWNAASAADVKIKTQNGSVITGQIVSLENGTYRIKTDFGIVAVPAASVVSMTGLEEPLVPRKPASSGPLRLAGSTTIGDELAPALLEAYGTSVGAGDATWIAEGSGEQKLEAKGSNNSKFDAHLSRHGSGTAFTALADGKADIGMASRRIEPKEISSLNGAGFGDLTQPGQENVLALDGLIVVVNRDNPISALTIDQIRDLFSGKITDWSQVGGRSGPVAIYGRDSKSGTADTFKALVMAKTPVSSALQVVEGAEDVALKVQGNPGAIGYTGFAYLGDNKAVQIVTDCGLSFPANDLFVRTEEYPLARRLFLYTPAPATNTQTDAFLKLALGSKGQELARKKGFVDLEPHLADIAYARNGIALDLVSLSRDKGASREDIAGFLNYAQHAVNGNRISTTFRFQFGSAALDARAVRDIDRLADYLRSPSVSSRNVLIAGFADSVGPSFRSRQLSQQRALAIANLLREKGVTAKDVQGYGRVAPVACNTSPEGREKNRRVEVWLY